MKTAEELRAISDKAWKVNEKVIFCNFLNQELFPRMEEAANRGHYSFKFTFSDEFCAKIIILLEDRKFKEFLKVVADSYGYTLDIQLDENGYHNVYLISWAQPKR